MKMCVIVCNKCSYMNLCVKTCNFASSIQCRFGSQFSFLLRPFHRPGVDIPQPAAVPPIGCRITPSSWIIWPLLPAHTERNSASVPSTNHRHLAQYGRDGTHKEAGSGCQLVEPARLSLAHPVVSLWIGSTVWLQLGQECTLHTLCGQTPWHLFGQQCWRRASICSTTHCQERHETGQDQIP